MNVYRKLFRYVPQEKYYGLIAIFFSIASAVLIVMGYYFIYRFLDAVINTQEGDFAWNYALKTTFCLAIGGIMYLLSGLISHILGFRLETNLRKRGIDGLTDSGFRFFETHSSGATRKTIDDNAAQTHMIVAHLIPDNAQAFLVPILAILLGFFISLRVGIILVLLVLLGMGILFKMMGEKEFMALYQKSLENLSSEAVEYVRGIQVVKIFGASVTSFKAFYKAIKDYSKYAYDYSLSCKRPYVCYQWLFFALMGVLIFFSTLFFHRLGPANHLVIDLVMTLFLSGILFTAFMKIMWVSMYVFQGNYAVDQLENLFEAMQEDKLLVGEETVFLNNTIVFDKVTFSYGAKPVLNQLSFTLPEGRTYALVGNSGSGKSTIAKLISGFYTLDSGEIRVGDKPLTHYTREALNQQIAFVFQESRLFKKSIYENVALAKPEATRDEVMKALELAGCFPILEKFADREQTQIGKAGVYLSGGEKQRIAIARAILKDAPIVIMDEASAAIDPDNEHELQKAFKNLMKGKTVIMIAHRLSSIQNVNEILYIKEGDIIARGSHSDLLEHCSDYARLQQQYHQANEWRVGHAEAL